MCKIFFWGKSYKFWIIDVLQAVEYLVEISPGLLPGVVGWDEKCELLVWILLGQLATQPSVD